MIVEKLNERYSPEKGRTDFNSRVHEFTAKLNKSSPEDSESLIRGFIQSLDNYKVLKPLEDIMVETIHEHGVTVKENYFLAILKANADDTIESNYDKFKYLGNLYMDGKLFPLPYWRYIVKDIKRFYSNPTLYNRSDGDFQYTVNAYVILRYYNDSYESEQDVNENLVFGEDNGREIVLPKDEIYKRIDKLNATGSIKDRDRNRRDANVEKMANIIRKSNPDAVKNLSDKEIRGLVRSVMKMVSGDEE